MAPYYLDKSPGHWFSMISREFKSELLQAFKSHGYDLTVEHWGVLNSLWDKDGQIQSEIAKTTAKDKTNLTRILDVMERNKLVQRRAHEKDRRSYRIFLTEEARNLKEKLTNIEKKVTNNKLKCLSEKDKNELLRVMEILVKKSGLSSG